MFDRGGLDIRATGEPGVLGVSFEDAAALEQAADTVREGGAQRVELGARRCSDPTKAQRPVGTLDVDAVEDKQVEVHVEVERAAEVLDQRHRARLRVLLRETGLADQVGGETAMNDAEHRARDRRFVGEQEPKRVGHVQHPLTNGLGGEDLVDEERSALDHAP